MKLSIIDLERALGISPINVKDDLWLVVFL